MHLTSREVVGSQDGRADGRWFNVANWRDRRATNVTVRTLHYYEEIGLLAPTARSAAGHRLYGTDTVEQLYRITTLRQLGLSLERFAVPLTGPTATCSR